MKSWRKNWNGKWGLLIVGLLVWFVAIVVQLIFFVAPATSDGIRDGLSALITLNAVVLALIYATMQRAIVLSLRGGDMNTGFFEWTGMMTVMSMLGVLLGVIYLVWQPCRWMLGLTAALLVVAPGLVPVVAVQELMAQRRRTARAVDKRSAEKSGSRSEEEVRISDNVQFLTVRATEFEADSQDPFVGDLLGRRRVVEAACKVVSDISSPAVLLVEGEWGSGKTAFARMCAALLRSKSFERWNGAVVEFNAWTQSHTCEPSQDLVLALTSEIHGNDELREMLLNMVLEAQALKVAGGEIDAVQLAKYEARTETARFKNLLAEFVADNGGRVAIFIDELDRCRPDHALQVLETVRNLFDVAGVVVVVTVNLDALEHAVRSLLGSDCDVDTYLRRFIDLRMALPRPQSGDLHKFYEHLLVRTGLAARFKGRDGYSKEILWALAAVHPNSLRDLEQAIHRAVVLLASIEAVDGNSSGTVRVREETALTLLVLRDADRKAYEDFVSGCCDGFDASNALAEALPLGDLGSNMTSPASALGSPIVYFRFLCLMEALLLAVAQDGLDAGQLNEDLGNRYNAYGRGEHWQIIRKHYAELRQRTEGDPVDLQELADLIELATYHPRRKSTTDTHMP